MIALLGVFTMACGIAVGANAGTLAGYLRDQNWYARYQSQPYGVGYYEYGINANPDGAAGTGGAAATDVYGRFSMGSLAAGLYTVVSWDVWWRSSYAFNVSVPAGGSSPSVDLRLKATMWGYPAFWDDTGYHEFGQTFTATGPISMIYLRAPFSTSYTLTIHADGPGGPQVGAARTFSGGDQRPIYAYGDMPTVAGRTYYARIRTSSPSIGGVLMQMDPRPDFSDPMPGGCLWLGNGSVLVPYPDRDLGLVIMSDDDGLITNLHARSSGAPLDNANSVGQTFIARGTALISAAFWLADPAAPTYEVRVFEGGPGGGQVGTAKRGRPPRVTADPEMIVAWTPGECPLTPGQVYYVEVTRAGGGSFSRIYVNRANPFPHGQGHQNGVAVSGADLAGTLMEEAAQGAATQSAVRFVTEPAVAEAERESDRFVIRWRTDTASDSQVEYAPGNPPYTGLATDANLVLDHALTLSGLQAQTLYHLRITSAAPGHRTGVSRDLALCTRPTRPNLLTNPGFESGSGSSPRKTIPGWTKSGGLDMGMSDGTWFGELKPHTGQWLLEGALNGSSSDSHLYQRVSVTPGKRYTFSAWVFTKALERINNQTVEKYDVWNDRNRLIHVRLGLDPLGGTNPNASSVRWTPRLYSHLRYSNPALATVASNTTLTAFVHFKGEGVEWHLYGIDDCVLTETDPPPPLLIAPRLDLDGSFSCQVGSEAGGWVRIEGSSDLGSWVALTNMLNATGLTRFTDFGGAPRRFYRASAPASP
ncbi:MAG: hypothetical protein KA191_12920 [Verrucomicrobia bacterium]|nr:hypothetical protein [Verrucomicrobiota bacterium]MDI9379451.1 hypothetical protein [Verrucomicrobiota bacterium]NMD21252.1 hypothetical protein [Verrucomicrobiota bacterium]HNU99905.1 hypothetical protein [Verrucomicrobiota bacterium]HOF47633.1 hypothetical protein [Verrucomicrobiota bacterium]